MTIDRMNYPGVDDLSAAGIILTRKPQRVDKDGRVISGDYPNKYFTQTSGYFGKDASISVKNADDFHYDFQHILMTNRLIRENIPDDRYDLDDFIEELNREYAAINLDLMNKEGANNNRRLIQTTISEVTSTNLDGTEKKQGGIGGLFSRK